MNTMIPWMRQRRHLQIYLLVAILAVAFLFRFSLLETVPPGLYPDEAINGNDAVKALKFDEWKVFYTDNNGREGLFITLQAFFIKTFGGQQPWVLRFPSALFGFLTVLGLYLLARELFNWQIASISSFYLAISFWHVNFSRIAFRGIMAPFLLVFGFYFLWKGLKELKLKWYLFSGLFLGLGFYTYIGFRFVPFIVGAVLLVYWQKIKKDYSHEEYEHLRNELVRGFAVLLVTTIIVALPIGIYFWQNPADFFGRSNQVSVFAAENSALELLKSTGKTLAMFNFVGDHNWRHNVAGRPQLFWPISIFFVFGIIRSVWKCLRMKRRHGHFNTIHTLLLGWFVVMLFPVILTWEGIPHALRAIGVIPVVMLFAGEGTWWVMTVLTQWYRLHDYHPRESSLVKKMESVMVVGLVFGIFFAAAAYWEYNVYFNQWAKQTETRAAFAADFVALGEELEELSDDIPKYVVVNASGVLVDAYDPFTESVRGIPMPAQTVMFMTSTENPQCQQNRNLYYILPEEEHLIDNDDAKVFRMLE